MEKELTYNTVIVGAGVSGLYAALKLPKEQNILLICKEDLPSCDSMLAQGGICVQRDETDYDSFFEDTLKAGHGAVFCAACCHREFIQNPCADMGTGHYRRLDSYCDFPWLSLADFSYEGD